MEEVDAVQNLKNDAFKAHNLPVFPKEEQFEEEFDKIMEARYRDGSALVRFADEYDAKDSVDGGSGMPSVKDPMVWKVKCTVDVYFLLFCDIKPNFSIFSGFFSCSSCLIGFLPLTKCFRLVEREIQPFVLCRSLLT